jgi:hypothetical protein
LPIYNVSLPSAEPSWVRRLLSATRLSGGYTIRLPANSVLQSRIGYLLKRPVERPPHEVRRHFASFSHQAQSWAKPRRIVAKSLPS